MTQLLPFTVQACPQASLPPRPVQMRVALAFVEHRVNVWLRFGQPVRETALDRLRRVATFEPDAVCCRVKWIGNDYGTALWQLMVLQAPMLFVGAQRISGVTPGARILLRADGELQVKAARSHRRHRGTGHRSGYGCRHVLAHSRQPAGSTPAAAALHRRAAYGASCARSVEMSRRVLFAGMGIGLAALCAPFVMPMAAHENVFLVYNPTDSVPRGWYRVSSIANAASLHVGSIVLVRLPADVAAFAGQRGYLPSGVPILKRIGALAPQSICVRGQVVLIDGAVAASTRTHDGARRPLRAWQHCRPLANGELFLLSDTSPASFDSRYFGPITASAVLGIAWPL